MKFEVCNIYGETLQYLDVNNVGVLVSLLQANVLQNEGEYLGHQIYHSARRHWILLDC